MENRHLQDQGLQRTTRKLPSLHQVYRGLPQGSYSVHWSRAREGGDDKAVLELNASCDGLLWSPRFMLVSSPALTAMGIGKSSAREDHTCHAARNARSHVNIGRRR